MARLSAQHRGRPFLRPPRSPAALGTPPAPGSVAMPADAGVNPAPGPARRLAAPGAGRAAAGSRGAEGGRWRQGGRPEAVPRRSGRWGAGELHPPVFHAFFSFLP